MKARIPAPVINFITLTILYTICRLIFIWVNHSYFTEADPTDILTMMRGGVRFDVAGILYLNLPYLFMVLLPFHFRENNRYATATKLMYMIPNTIGIVANISDTIYFPFTTRRTTWRIFDEFANDSNIASVVVQACADHWLLTLTGLAICIVMYILYAPYREYIPIKGTLYHIFHSIAMVLIIYLTVCGIRGGFGVTTRPITISNAAQYCSKPEETAIVLNTPFSMIRTIENTSYSNPGYFDSEEELERYCNPICQPTSVDSAFLNRNVVIIILESFATEYSSYFNPGMYENNRGFTPFLDSLASIGLSFRYSLATGKQSIEALPAIFAGIPGLIEPYAVTQYSNNDICALPRLLSEKGYETAFFHGADANSLGIQAFARSTGFKHLHDRSTYGNDDDFDGTWAIWDEEFMQYSVKETGMMRQPFLSCIFTASSHHPFRLPKRYEGMFPEGPEPMYRSIGYADYALRRFFETASREPWFDNTLFVLTGDHTSIITNSNYLNGRGLYQVPIIYYCPSDSTLHGLSDKLTAQTDITPSILDYLHSEQPCFSFGKSVFSDDTVRYVVNYHRPSFQIFSDSLMLQFSDNKTQAIYNFISDSTLAHPLRDVPQKENLEKHIKAYIQQYQTRMIENRLTPDR